MVALHTLLSCTPELASLHPSQSLLHLSLSHSPACQLRMPRPDFSHDGFILLRVMPTPFALLLPGCTLIHSMQCTLARARKGPSNSLERLLEAHCPLTGIRRPSSVTLQDLEGVLLIHSGESPSGLGQTQHASHSSGASGTL